VNNVLSMMTKKYPRVVLVHEDRLLCCKLDSSDLCTFKWMKRLAAVTRLRRIPKPNYAVTSTVEVAVEFDEVDPETGCLCANDSSTLLVLRSLLQSRRSCPSRWSRTPRRS
jgi:hypothetical protein